MLNDPVNIIDIFVMLSICFMSLFILRQTFHAHGGYAWLFRIVIFNFSASIAIKVFQRFEDDFASTFDLWRDSSIFFLFIVIIFFHKNRFGKL